PERPTATTATACSRVPRTSIKSWRRPCRRLAPIAAARSAGPGSPHSIRRRSRGVPFRQFLVHFSICSICDRRVQGRHPLQTSHALGAAASKVGPDAQAAVVVLNKTFGLSHLKVAAVFRALFEITLTRGASTQIVLRAGDRLQPAYEEVRR